MQNVESKVKKQSTIKKRKMAAKRMAEVWRQRGDGNRDMAKVMAKKMAAAAVAAKALRRRG
jgi:hypothetical protein